MEKDRDQRSEIRRKKTEDRRNASTVNGKVWAVNRSDCLAWARFGNRTDGE
jgi:hypothetical protein